MALNKVFLMGRLTADPELKTTTNGTEVTSFTMAVDKPYNKDHDHPEADFFDIVAWKTNARNISTFFKKGSRIIVEGFLQSRSFNDKNGNKRKVIEVVVESFQFVDRRDDGSNSTSSTPTPKNNKQEEPMSDDLPF